jgi:ATP-binding cassette subfamily B protein
MNSRQASLVVLRRLAPYVQPVRGRLLGSGAAALGGMLAGLGIPLLIQRIVDGPVAHRDRSALVLLSLGVLALGVLEAGLIYLRRALGARPTTDIEKRMRADLYHHLQHLPVAFHDRWPSGQLLSRAVSDLTTIRRFLAFSGIFLVVNVLTVLAGMVVLLVIAPAFGVLTMIMAAPMVVLCQRYWRRYELAARRAQDQVGDLATTVAAGLAGLAAGRDRQSRRSDRPVLGGARHRSRSGRPAGAPGPGAAGARRAAAGRGALPVPGGRYRGTPRGGP